MSEPFDQIGLMAKVSEVFSPAAPINRRDLFAGRLSQLQRVFDAVSSRGQHVVIFGERGVGKTSLANIVKDVASRKQSDGSSLSIVKINCSKDDSFSTVWVKAFSEIVVRTDSGTTTIGFSNKPIVDEFTAAEWLPQSPSPNDVRKIADRLGATAFIFDEFDRIQPGEGALFADTIKTLSDASSPCALVLVGVAHDIDTLIKEHISIDRALVQILMPRMTVNELHEILNKAMNALKMNMSADARNLIVLLSQGLPHYTHVLGRASTLQAIEQERAEIGIDDVNSSINESIQNTHQSIVNSYQAATASPRKDTLFKQVLLACALAEVDDLGFFAPPDVRDPLSKIMGKRYEIPNFSQHLDKFATSDRGNALEKSGKERRFRFRFSNPLLQPFVIMRGIADKMLTGDLMNLLQKKTTR